MLQRGWLIAITIITAVFLLFLQNVVLTGTQDITLTVSEQQPGVASINLVDVSQRPIVLRDGVEAEVQAQIERLATANVKRGREALPLQSLELDASRRSFVATYDPTALTAVDIRRRFAGHTVKIDNPSRSIWHQNLGIDLRGGVEFITRLYDRNNNETPATEDEVAILRQRLDARGLTEPQVFRLQNGDVQVVIPGGTEADAARTRRVLETTGVLEVREMKPVASRHARFASVTVTLIRAPLSMLVSSSIMVMAPTTLVVLVRVVSMMSSILACRNLKAKNPINSITLAVLKSAVIWLNQQRRVLTIKARWPSILR